MPRTPSVASVTMSAIGLLSLVAGVGVSVQASSGFGLRRTPVVLAVERAAPAVVNVTVDSMTGGSRGGMSRGQGAGVIVHPQGFVVTNSHVVRGSSRVYVSLSKASGGKTFEARVLEDDPSHDLALLRIAQTTIFPYVALCTTCDVMVGETAIAIGNPYGLGDTVTVGVVSAKGRSATFSTGQTIDDLIQTDASINLGNSGGALLNLEGQLIGINSALHPNAQGIAFTVPADDVQRMLDRNLGVAARPPPPGPDLEDDPAPEAVRTPWTAPAPLAAAPKAAPAPEPRTFVPSPFVAPPTLPSGRPAIGLTLRAAPGAVLVAAVSPGSNAEIAGLRAGDLILDVDGKAMTSPSEVVTLFQGSPSGKTYFVNLRRNEKKTNAIVVIP